MTYKLRSRILKCPSNGDFCDVDEKPDQSFGQEIYSLKGRGKVMITTQKAAKASTVRRRSVRILGDNEIVYLAEHSDTEGAYSLFEMTFQPGMGPPPHIHTREDESWYVLDGAFDFLIGDKTQRATAGWYGVGPRGAAHAFTVVGDRPAKMLMVGTPAGFERFFDDLAELPCNPTVDFDQFKALSEKYGMQFVEPQ